MEIVLASHLNKENTRLQISKIFVEGFYEWIKFFSKDKDTLEKAFSHMFNLDLFYVAVINGEIAGFVSIRDKNSNNIILNKKELQKNLGLFMGYFAYKVLRKEFEYKKYPFTVTNEMLPIEFVATSTKYQRCEVASKIIKYIFKNNSNKSLILEVADTNLKAVALYKKLGFREIKRIKMKDSKRSGVNNLIYMEYLNT